LIVGQNNEVIGYRITAANAGPFPGADPFGSMAGAAPGIPGPQPLPPPPTSPPGTIPIANPPIPGGASGPSGDMVVSFGPAMAENVATARVYPLGNLTTVTKFNEVEETLREVFKAGGISSTDVKLALHEKTNVLIVTGNQRVHDAVKQLLDALEKNTAAADLANRRGEEARRDMIQMQVRAEAEKEERMRLMKQMEQIEAQRSELAQELERVKAARPK
jgi:hypothetical protein